MAAAAALAAALAAAAAAVASKAEAAAPTSAPIAWPRRALAPRRFPLSRASLCLRLRLLTPGTSAAAASSTMTGGVMTCCLSVRGRGAVAAPPRAAMSAPMSTPTTKAAAVVARCTTMPSRHRREGDSALCWRAMFGQIKLSARGYRRGGGRKEEYRCWPRFCVSWLAGSGSRPRGNILANEQRDPAGNPQQRSHSSRTSAPAPPNPAGNVSGVSGRPSQASYPSHSRGYLRCGRAGTRRRCSLGAWSGVRAGVGARARAKLLRRLELDDDR